MLTYVNFDVKHDGNKNIQFEIDIFVKCFMRCNFV